MPVEVLLAIDVLPNTIAPYITLMILGFAVGTFGHMAGSQVTVGIGIAMIFVACLLAPLALVATEDEPETPGAPPIYAPGTR